MLDQLKELLEMQRVLDESIFKEHGITEYPLENMKLALFDELGELLHEFPTKYKHWKKTAVDNREKGLEEYVDCLHFCLSLSNYLGVKLTDYHQYDRHKNDACKMDLSFLLVLLCDKVSNEQGNRILNYLFALGNYFGFTWEEIYEAYKKKNAVNYERLRSNY